MKIMQDDLSSVCLLNAKDDVKIMQDDLSSVCL